MARDFTVTGLIDSVKLRGMVPSSQNLYTPDRILGIMNDFKDAVIVPWILSQRQDFFKEYLDIAVDTTTNDYPLPKNTIGEKIESIFFGSDGPAAGQWDFSPLVQGDTTDIYSKDFAARGRYAFYVRGDRFIVWPQPTDPSKVFRVFYYRRPNLLVDVPYCAKITVVNTGTNTVTVTGKPATWLTGATPGLDFIEGKPHFKALRENLAPTTVTGNDLQFSALPTGLAAGDYLCETGLSCVPQLPLEIWPFLVQGTVVQVLKGLGNPLWQAAQDELKLTMSQAKNLVASRVDDQVKKVTPIWW